MFLLLSVSGSLWPHGLQHVRLLYSSLVLRVNSQLCPLSQWCHPFISSSAIPFSCFQSFPSLGSFPMNWLFSSGGQNIGASTITSVLPMNIQDWFPLGLTGLMSLQSKGLLSVFYNTIVQKFTSWWVPPSRKANMIINFLNIYAVSSLIPSFQQWNLG